MVECDRERKRCIYICFLVCQKFKEHLKTATDIVPQILIGDLRFANLTTCYKVGHLIQGSLNWWLRELFGPTSAFLHLMYQKTPFCFDNFDSSITVKGWPCCYEKSIQRIEKAKKELSKIKGTFKMQIENNNDDLFLVGKRFVLQCIFWSERIYMVLVT